MNVRKTLSGYCPEQKGQYSIQVTLAKVESLDIPGDHFKPLAIFCEYYLEHSCSVCGDGTKCPLLKSVQ